MKDLFCDVAGIVQEELDVLSRIWPKETVEMELLHSFAVTFSLLTLKHHKTIQFLIPSKHMDASGISLQAEMQELLNWEHVVLVFERVGDDMRTKRYQFDPLELRPYFP